MIDLKIEQLDAMKDFLQQVSDSVFEYSRKLVSITGEESSESDESDTDRQEIRMEEDPQDRS